jgi:hypothetical protein
LRTECVEAKEALTRDTDVVIPAALPDRNESVRLTRAEFEAMIRPALAETINALRRALTSASVTPEDVHAVLLVGGSSRIPLVAQMVSAALGRPTAVDAHPKHAVAQGAALAAAERAELVEPAEATMPPVAAAPLADPPAETAPAPALAAEAGAPPPRGPSRPARLPAGPVRIALGGVAVLLAAVVAVVAWPGGDGDGDGDRDGGGAADATSTSEGTTSTAADAGASPGAALDGTPSPRDADTGEAGTDYVDTVQGNEVAFYRFEIEPNSEVRGAVTVTGHPGNQGSLICPNVFLTNDNDRNYASAPFPGGDVNGTFDKNTEPAVVDAGEVWINVEMTDCRGGPGSETDEYDVELRLEVLD